MHGEFVPTSMQTKIAVYYLYGFLLLLKHKFANVAVLEIFPPNFHC